MPREVIRTPSAPQPVGPYSQAIMVNGLLFVSGQGAIDPNSGRLAGTDIQSQTRQTLTNVQNIVEASGMSMRDLVRVAVYLKNMKDFKEMNEVYKSFFPDAPPARTTIQAELPLPEMLIEIDAVAHRG
ncbi:MAG TPA: Rid family detoxifying hydrolase [archaeon]|nr:Rid family detoxifying hydrolase [archaeon]